MAERVIDDLLCRNSMMRGWELAGRVRGPRVVRGIVGELFGER
jgi:hypothetical protein